MVDPRTMQSDSEEELTAIRRSGSEKTRPFLVVLTFLSAIGGFLFGYDTGVVSGAMLLVREEFHLNDVWHEAIVGVTIGFAWIFSLVGGFLTEFFGRKPVIILASFVFAVGAVVMGVSPTKEVLLVGRIIVGIGIGLVSCSVPLYIAEASSSHYRGKLVSFYVLMIGGGQFLASLLAAFCATADSSHGWRSAYLFLSNIFFIFFVCFFCGQGLSSMTVPMYIAEVSTPEIRGFLVTMNTIFVTGGQFIASVICGIFSSDTDNGWRYMLGLSGIPALIQFIGFLGMPESPRWLIKHGRLSRATDILNTIRGSEANVEAEVDAIRRSCEENEVGDSVKKSVILFEIMRTPSVRRALILGCGLQMFQQLAGINTVMYYSAMIVQMAGVSDDSTAIWLSAVTAGINFVCTFLGLYLVEKIGRRVLTLASLGGVVLSLILLAVGFQLATVFSPSSTFTNEMNAHCNYTYCGSCSNDENCGFCYASVDGSNLNGSCISVAANTSDNAANGRCSDMDHASPNIHWAVGFCPSPYQWMPILGLCLYLFCFAPGMGPMPWTINSEIYPLWARSTCYAIATSTNWLFNMLISMSFLSLVQALTKYGAFYFYAGLALLGFIFVMVDLPETRGKSLEEVEGLFALPICCGSSGIGGALRQANGSRPEPHNHQVQYVHIRGLNTRDRQDSNESGDDP